MRKFTLTHCKICGEERTARGFSQHIQKTHGILIEDYIVTYEFDNIYPTCACGCGTRVTLRGYQVMDYADGHCPTGHYKLGESPKRDYEKWKNNLTVGIRKYNKQAKIEDPTYRSGTNNNFFGRKHTDKTKDKLRVAVEEQIKGGKHPFIGNNNGRIGSSSLEGKFKKYLDDVNIEYIKSYQVPYVLSTNQYPRNKYYDFYIPQINTLIEIHGSYWHPQTVENLTEMQKGNLKNDEFKKNLAKEKGFELVTIYDHQLDEFINTNKLLALFDKRADVAKLVVES